jgi:uncharacterized membrane protein YbhN (UPF0104 family)
MSRGGWARLLVGVAILGGLVWRVGTGPFVVGLRAVDLRSALAASAIAAITTTCAAWRWCLVARALGGELALRPAVAAYYRSQFLNTVLPFGVLGDVHRGVRYGHEQRAVSRGVRAVVWERVAGQVVLVLVAVVVLLVLPSPVQGAMPALMAALGAALLGAALVAPHVGRLARRTTRRDVVRRAGLLGVRDGMLTARAWPGVGVASVVVVAGHAATFVIAARSVGTDLPLESLVPLAILTLVAMSVPANLGGWGPREGMAAWAFAAVGLGAAQGIAAAAAYGVLVLIATAPGFLVLLAHVWSSPSGALPAQVVTPLATTSVQAEGSRA